MLRFIFIFKCKVYLSLSKINYTFRLVNFTIMKNICEAEQNKLQRWGKFQLPNKYKKIGWAIIIGVFILMIAKRFVDEPTWVKPVLRNVMILGFLMVSISKEKIEDELMASLRATSYRLALIIGVLYALVQPYVTYAIESLIDPENAVIDNGYFQVLLYILLVQIMFFHALKRSS